MRVKVVVSDLRSAVEQAQVTIDKSIPTFQGLYVEAALNPDESGKLMLYSQKPGARTLVTIPAEVEVPGKVMLRPEQLLAALKGHEGASVAGFTYISGNGPDEPGRLAGTCNSSRFRLGLLTGTELMSQQIEKLPITGTNGSRYDAGLLADVIKKAAWCANTNSQNERLVDALEFKRTPFGFKAQASDGNIAVRVQVNTDLHPEEMTIPRMPFEAIQKVLGKHYSDQVSIIKGNPVNGEYNELYFRLAGVFFGAATSVKKLPNIEAVFANQLWQPTRKVIISRNILSDMLGRLSAFADRTAPSIRFELAEDTLRLSTQNPDGDCVEELKIAYTGDSVKKIGGAEVYISHGYISKILTSLTNDLIVLGIRDETSPLFVFDEPESEPVRTCYVVMGVRPPAGRPKKKDEPVAAEQQEQREEEAPVEEDAEVPVEASVGA